MAHLQASASDRATQLPPISALAGPSRSNPSSPPPDREGREAAQWQRQRGYSTSVHSHPQHAMEGVRGTATEEVDRYDRHHSHHHQHQDGQRAVAPPGWTRHWADRAPPPRPLRTPSLGPQASRRHHPYGAQLSVAAAAPSSPSWPAHIGIDDAQSKPTGVPSVLQAAPASRPRASTVISSHQADDAAPRTASHPRPSMIARSYTSDDRASELRLAHYGPDVYRDTRRDSGQTTQGGPSSPLLFAPLSGFAEPFHPQPSYSHHHHKPPSLAVPPPHAYRSTGVTPLLNDRLTMAEEAGSPHGSFFPLSPHSYEASRPFSAAETRSPYGTSPSLRADTWSGGKADHPTLHHHVSLDRLNQGRKRRRPPYSYSSLIAQAISSSPQNRMTLREIYTWISNSYPELYSMDGVDSQGWQNTVRHNLSLNKSFVKVARTARDIYDSCSSTNLAQTQAARGKGGWWTIDPVVAAAQLGPQYRGLAVNGGPSGEASPLTPQEELHPGHNRRPSASSMPASQDRRDSLSGTSSDELESPPARIPSVLIKDPASMTIQLPRRTDAASPAMSSPAFRPGVDVPSVLARPRGAEGFLAPGHTGPSPSEPRRGSASAVSTSNPGLGLGFKIPSVIAPVSGRSRGYTTSSSREIRPVASHSSLSSTTSNARMLPAMVNQRSVSGGHGDLRREWSSSPPTIHSAPASAPATTAETKMAPPRSPVEGSFAQVKQAESDGDSDMSDAGAAPKKEESVPSAKMSIRDLLC